MLNMTIILSIISDKKNKATEYKMYFSISLSFMLFPSYLIFYKYAYKNIYAYKLFIKSQYKVGEKPYSYGKHRVTIHFFRYK